MENDKNKWKRAASAVNLLWGQFDLVDRTRHRYQEQTDCNPEIFTARRTSYLDTPFKYGYSFLLHKGQNMTSKAVAAVVPSYSGDHVNTLKSTKYFQEQMRVLGIPQKPSPEVSYGIGLGCEIVNKINWDALEPEDYLESFADGLRVDASDFYSSRRPQELADLRLAFLYFAIEKAKLGSISKVMKYFGFNQDPSGYKHRKKTFGPQLEKRMLAGRKIVQKKIEEDEKIGRSNVVAMDEPHLFAKRFAMVV